jgi:hypothetical protein
MGFLVGMASRAPFNDSRHRGADEDGFASRLWAMTGEDAEGSKFYHRANTDGTIDSTCRCFLTIARADIGPDLQGPEAAHQCDDKEPSILTELRSLLAPRHPSYCTSERRQGTPALKWSCMAGK